MRKIISTSLKICLFTFFLLVGEMSSAYATSRYAVASGYWNSTSTWSASSGGSPGASVPVAGDDVYIEQGYTVTVTANAECANITINEESSLIISGNSTLTVNNNVTVNGTLTVQNTASYSATNTTFNSGSTYVHDKNGGTIPNASWNNASTCLIKGITDTKPDGLNQSFGNFTWNCSNQTANISFATNLSTINGNLTVNNTGSGAVNLMFSGPSSYSCNVQGNFVLTGGIFRLVGNEGSQSGVMTINIKGNLTLSGGTFDVHGNSTYGGTGTVNVSRNALIQDGAILTKTSSGTGNLNFSGNFTNNGGTFTSGTSTVTFNGTSAQTIGGTSATTFYRLTINNTGTSGNNTVTLLQPTTVTNTLTLTSGIVNTDSTNVLSVTNTATNAISEGSSSSFVNGPLKRSLPANLASGRSYVFPVGAGTNYYPFTLVNQTTGATAPTVTIEAKAANCGGTFDNTLSSLSNTEYWSMATTGDFTKSSISVSRPTAIAPYRVIAGSTAVNGTYTSLGGTAGTNGVTSSNPIGTNRYFALASTPYISLSTGSLSGFTYIEGNGPSGIQSFTVNAEGLTDNVLITAPTDFEVSLSGGTSFSGISQVTIPIISGSVNNVSVYVRMKAGLSQGSIGPEQLTVSSTGFTSQTISLSGTVTVRPVITLSPASLTGFTYVYTAGPSAQQSFTVSGTNLYGNVTLTAPIDYEISTTSGSGFASTISLSPSGGTLSSQTIYVRLRAGLGVTTYNENITATSQYAETKTVSLSGSITAAGTLIATPSILSGFIYTSGNGPSASQTFSLSGSNLGTNTVTVTAPANFEISTDKTNFSASFTLTPTGGAVNQTVYVRLQPELAVGSYGLSNITLSATGAVTKTVALSGKVVSSATLIAYPTILGGFSYVAGDGPSSAQAFTVSGASLGSNPINISPSDLYEISLSSNSGYLSSISLTPTNGTVNATTIYVRLKTGIASAGPNNGSVTITSTGATTQTVTLNGQVYGEPAIVAGGGGDYCVGSTIGLTSSGDNIQSQYWTGPNSFYSTEKNPSISNSTTAMSGTYTVTGNVIVSGNLVSNGDFESGNVGFGSSYGYTTTSLYPEGLYAIIKDPHTLHDNFTTNGDHTSGSGYQMVVNGATNPGMVVWSQSVAVVSHADYEFSYWVQTVVNGGDSNPAQLQLYINGVAVGSIFTANPATAQWKKFVFNTNAGSNTTLNIEIVNQNTIAGGNDFALDDIVLHQIATVSGSTNVTVSTYQPVSVSVSYSPSVVYSNTPVTFTATPTNGGSAPVYEWSVNGAVVGTNSTTYTCTPKDGDEVSCKLTSSYPCATGNPASASVTMSVLNQYNFWMGTLTSTDWGTASNWTGGYVPLAGSNVEYATEANYGTAAVNDLQLDQDRVIGSLINATNKKLIIPTGKALTVNNTITISDSQNPNLVLIKSGRNSSTAQGTLIFHNDADHPVYATVEMYSKAWINPSGATNQKYFWQYFGLPFRSLRANPSFYGAYVRKWDETGTSIYNHWVQLGNSDVLQSFLGYEICQPAAKTYSWQGILENRDFNSEELAYTATALYPGQHIFGNSYTAAIDIKNINFGSNMEATVYLYNTGSYNNWETNEGGTSYSSSNTAAGTYAAIPQNQAGQVGIQGQIPSMQGFLVKAMSSAAGNTISIPYSSVAVKNTTLQRAKATEGTTSTEKQYVRIDLKADSFTVDRMWIFNEPHCTHSFDNGWDGPKILAGEGVPALFSEEKDGIYQVNSVEDMNDTNIGFQGEDNKLYSLEIHSENLQHRYASLYLYDKTTEKITEITSDSTVYTFTNNSGTGIQQRFRIIANLNSLEEGNDERLLHLFPLDKKIVLENKSKEGSQAVIYDLMGQMVDNFSVQPQTIQVSPHDLTTGVYVVKVFTQDKKIIKKIIIR